MSYIVSVDIGSSSIRGAIFDGALNPLAGSEFASTNVEINRNGGIDPLSVLEEAIKVLDGLAAYCETKSIHPKAASFSCFWHSLLGINSRLEPITELYSWAFTSAEDEVPRLLAELDDSVVHDRSGCHFHSSYWPAKLSYLARTLSAQFHETRYWISFSDFLHSRLTGKLETSISMASGTGMLDLRRGEWDRILLEFLGIDAERLPWIHDENSGSLLTEEFRDRWPSFNRTCFHPAIGDGAANNLGSGCAKQEMAAVMVGTSAALRVLFRGEIPESIPDGLFCYRLDRERVVIGGALSDGGGLYRWITESMGIRVDENELSERYHMNPPGYHGLSFLPFVFGERSTGYHPDAKGSVIGITRGTDGTDLMIAALESVGYRFAEILDRVATVVNPKTIVASGGALESSPILRNILADVLGTKLMITDTSEASLRGAAMYGLEREEDTTDSAVILESEGTEVPFDPERHSAYRTERKRHKEFYERCFPQ